MMVQNTQLAVPLDPRSNSLHSTVICQFHNAAPDASYTSIPGLLRGRTRRGFRFKYLHLKIGQDTNVGTGVSGDVRLGVPVNDSRCVGRSSGPSSSSIKQCQKKLFVPEDDALRSFETSGATHKATQHHTPVIPL